MFLRENYLEDPWVSIRDHNPKPNHQMVYAENSTPLNRVILQTEGGMDVFIRNNNHILFG